MSNNYAKRIDIVQVKLVKEASMKYEPRCIDNPNNAAELAKKFIGDSDREQMLLICVNNKNEPIIASIISTGSINESIVHPREVFKAAILSNAKGIILAHNHLSMPLEASEADIALTKKITEAGKIIGIELLDHIIVHNNGKYISLKEKRVF